jgi:hypothetical protein
VANGDLSQEDYLANSTVKDVIFRGIKKMITEVSSMKTLAMVAIVCLNFFGKLDSMSTVIGLLGLIGAKEIDFTQITEIIKNKFGK